MDLHMSKYLVDSSSLVSLVRYYHPFDQGKRLMDSVHRNFEDNNWLLLNSVRDEIKRIAEGIVVNKYQFLGEEEEEEERNKIKPLPEIIATMEQQKHIDNNWVVDSVKDKLKPEEYSNERQGQVIGADFQLILTAMTAKNKKMYTIVTEETETPNDNKLFKKIPIICKQEEIDYITLPELLRRWNIQFSVK